MRIHFQGPGGSGNTGAASQIHDVGRGDFCGIQSPNNFANEQKVKRGKVGCKCRPLAGAFEGAPLSNAIAAFNIKSGKGLDRPSNLLKVKRCKVPLFQSAKPA
jgi:hypothetical protein